MSRCSRRYRLLRSRPWVSSVLQVLYYVSFAGLAVTLFWKCRYGFGNIDEAFYLTIPYRFVQGDHMILHEWHMTQFAGFTMIPIMWIYRLLNSSTEGIILSFRYIYTLIWCAACLFFEIRLRRIHRAGARFVSLILLAYAPYGVMALSYNSLVLLYLVNSVVFLLCAGKRQNLQFVLAGLFFAGAVLCCPYLIAPYAVVSIAVIAAKIMKKKPSIPFNAADCFACWCWFTSGTLLLATVFLITMFAGASPEQVIKSLELALQDPEHDAFSFRLKIKEYFEEIIKFTGLYGPLALGLLAVISWFAKQGKALCLAAACGVAAVYLWKYAEPGVIINLLMYPLSLSGFYVMLVTRNKKTRWIGWIWLLPGLLGTMCFSFSSNQGFFAISNGAVVPSLASVMMLWMHCGELEKNQEAGETSQRMHFLASLAVSMLLLFQLVVEFQIRLDSVFGEQGLMEQKDRQVLIQKGPEKGVLASTENAQDYLATYRDVEEINQKKVLFLSYRTWMPLVNDNENAAFSAWLSVYRFGMDRSVLERLEAYYKLCPEKRPEIIFLDHVYADQLDYFDSDSFDAMPLDSGNYLIRPIEAKCRTAAAHGNR